MLCNVRCPSTLGLEPYEQSVVIADKRVVFTVLLHCTPIVSSPHDTSLLPPTVNSCIRDPTYSPSVHTFGSSTETIGIPLGDNRSVLCSLEAGYAPTSSVSSGYSQTYPFSSPKKMRGSIGVVRGLSGAHSIAVLCPPTTEVEAFDRVKVSYLHPEEQSVQITGDVGLSDPAFPRLYCIAHLVDEMAQCFQIDQIFGQPSIKLVTRLVAPGAWAGSVSITRKISTGRWPRGVTVLETRSLDGSIAYVKTGRGTVKIDRAWIESAFWSGTHFVYRVLDFLSVARDCADDGSMCSDTALEEKADETDHPAVNDYYLGTEFRTACTLRASAALSGTSPTCSGSHHVLHSA
ncbi:hypothetical protein B0H11DRAFT_2226912 [Mycena galericulata]|nr:hypothetical protein B0H11DRAFT_2226912 [Mycena galericulata]